MLIDWAWRGGTSRQFNILTCFGLPAGASSPLQTDTKQFSVR
jgi:hypothetical protein